jgi:hypothetical protein
MMTERPHRIAKNAVKSSRDIQSIKIACNVVQHDDIKELWRSHLSDHSALY